MTSDLLDFAGRGGRIRLVASPHLTREDVAEITAAYERRDEIIAKALERTILESDDQVPFGILGFLISRSALEIKIAVVEDGTGGLGLYHEKMGLFTDSAGDFVAFSGSANESINGLVSNFESISVFRSWELADSDRAEEHRLDFTELWDNRTSFLTVLDFPTAAKRRLIEAYQRTRAEVSPLRSSQPTLSAGYGLPELPPGIVLRSYQDEAIVSWAKAGGKGILSMATGTGKTITALALMSRVFDALHADGKSLVAIVSCPFKTLVEQWSHEAELFGITPVKCFESKAIWLPRAEQAVRAATRGSVPFVLLICTNDTLRSEAFQILLSEVQAEASIFIADEVHNLGAEFNSSALPRHIALRLGLSATPERWKDEIGTKAIYDYFGEPVYHLGLKEAIELKALTPYRYHPILVRLSHDEMQQYIELSQQIQKCSFIDDSGSIGFDDNEPLKILLIRRARLLTGASGKLAALKSALEPYKNDTQTLLYCAEGRPGDSGEDDPKHIEATLRIVGHDLGMRADVYTSETNADTRRQLLARFQTGDIQALLAMRCLDEGVDLPVARRAFIMASSSNPRQFIQRRGRLLRRAPNKDRADIFDFIVIPPSSELPEESFSIERALIRSELRRVIEFASIAENGPAAMARLLDLRREYHLLDVA